MELNWAIVFVGWLHFLPMFVIGLLLHNTPLHIAGWVVFAELLTYVTIGFMCLHREHKRAEIADVSDPAV